MRKFDRSFCYLLFSLGVGGPSCWGDLDGEVGGREEGEDLGGDVVAAVVYALAE